jgi:hypothetical protein
VGIQLGENSSMKANADVALFGNDHYNVNGYVDYYMSSTGGAKADTTQNGVGALNVTSSNLVTVELKKPLNSSDAAGKDINWAVSETQTLIIIWDSNGRGSSGGNTNHYGNGASVDTAMVRTLLINSNSLSESGNPILSNFDTTTTVIVLVIVIVAILVVIVGVRWVRKRGAGKQPTSPQDSANLTMSQA